MPVPGALHTRCLTSRHTCKEEVTLAEYKQAGALRRGAAAGHTAPAAGSKPGCLDPKARALPKVLCFTLDSADSRQSHNI